MIDKKMTDNNNSRPLISIIVPVYNIIPYLPRCVHSICNQTYENLEIILVDDGSTDGTGELCDELAKEDERIVVFHKENSGSSGARNLGISKAKGEYLGFIDSDDYIEPDMYERLYEGIETYGVKCAQIGRDEVDEDGKQLPNICEPPSEAEVISSRDFLKELLMHRGDCSFCTKLIAREIFDIAEFFPLGVLNEDFHILVKKLAQIGNIASLPGQKYHVFYRIGSNSRMESRKQFSRVFGDNVDNASMITGLVSEQYPNDKELEKIAFRFNVFQRIDYLLHIPVEMMVKDGSPVSLQYQEIVRWMRHNYWKSMGNSILTAKNKVYHTLFAIAPKAVRKIHKKIKKL